MRRCGRKLSQRESTQLPYHIAINNIELHVRAGLPGIRQFKGRQTLTIAIERSLGRGRP
jgi:hypothetical protein